jgi:hypothetical protein
MTEARVRRPPTEGRRRAWRRIAAVASRPPSPLTTASSNQCHEQERGSSDQEVENPACGEAQDAKLRRSWRRLGANFLHEPDGIAALPSVEHEERVGECGTAATQLCENEPRGGVACPDEPVPLVPTTCASAYIACEAVGNRPMLGASLPTGASETNPFGWRESRRSGSPWSFRPYRQIQPHLAPTDRSCQS